MIDLKQNRPKGGRGTMAGAIDAIYENGVFKPLEKVDIKEPRRLR